MRSWSVFGSTSTSGVTPELITTSTGRDIQINVSSFGIATSKVNVPLVSQDSVIVFVHVRLGSEVTNVR